MNNHQLLIYGLIGEIHNIFSDSFSTWTSHPCSSRAPPHQIQGFLLPDAWIKLILVKNGHSSLPPVSVWVCVCVCVCHTVAGSPAVCARRWAGRDGLKVGWSLEQSAFRNGSHSYLVRQQSYQEELETPDGLFGGQSAPHNSPLHSRKINLPPGFICVSFFVSFSLLIYTKKLTEPSWSLASLPFIQRFADKETLHYTFDFFFYLFLIYCIFLH